MTTISIKDRVSSDLALRDYAKSFFQYLESLPDNKIDVDFTNILSMSRSFAHEYMVNEQNAKKQIRKINVPRDIEKMFDIVRNNTTKSQLIDVSTSKVLTI